MNNGWIKISWNHNQYVVHFNIDHNNEADDLIYTYADGSEIVDSDELDDLHRAAQPVLNERLRQATQPIEVNYDNHNASR